MLIWTFICHAIRATNGESFIIVSKNINKHEMGLSNNVIEYLDLVKHEMQDHSTINEGTIHNTQIKQRTSLNKSSYKKLKLNHSRITYDYTNLTDILKEINEFYFKYRINTALKHYLSPSDFDLIGQKYDKLNSERKQLNKTFKNANFMYRYKLKDMNDGIYECKIKCEKQKRKLNNFYWGCVYIPSEANLKENVDDFTKKCDDCDIFKKKKVKFVTMKM